MSMIEETTTKQVNPTTFAWAIVQQNMKKVQLQSEINDNIERLLSWCGKTYTDDNGVEQPNHILLPSGHIDELARIDDRFVQYQR